MPTFIHVSGGGMKVNGTGLKKIVNPSSTGIKKGDFVKAIEDSVAANSLRTFETNACHSMKVIQLADNKALLCYVNASTNQLIGFVLTVSGTNITIANKTVIATGVTLGNIAMEKMTNTSVLLCYTVGGENALIGRMLSISGTTITVGTLTTIHTYSTSSTDANLSVARASNTSALLVFTSGTAGFSAIIEITGNAISYSLTNPLITRATNIKIIPSFEGLFYIFYIDGAGKVMCSFIELFGRTVGINETIEVDSTSSTILDAITLNDRNAFVVYAQAAKGKGAIVNMTDGVVKVVAQSLITDSINAEYAVVKVNETKALIFSKEGTSSFVQAVNYTSGLLIGGRKYSNFFAKEPRFPALASVGGAKSIIAFQNFTDGSIGAYSLLAANSFVDKATSTDIVYGIAKTNGNANAIIDVIVP